MKIKQKDVDWQKIINTSMPDKAMKVQYPSRETKSLTSQSKQSAWVR